MSWLPRGLTILVLALLPVSVTAENVEATQASKPPAEIVQVLLKFLPFNGQGELGDVRLIKNNCDACSQLHDPDYARVNIRESIVQLRIPRMRSLELQFDVPATKVRRVLINQQDVVIGSNQGRLTVALPPIAEDAIWAAALATDIVEPGVVLRFEHADVARRGGAYAKGRFPDVERRAANALTFAQREVIRRLGLGTHVASTKTGTIMLMGFDTNFPAGHTDAPPHVHMHLRWANNIGSQISHFYLNEEGLVTHNRVGVRGFGAPSRTFERGQSFDTIDRFGHVVYSHTITMEGWLKIAAPTLGQSSCLIKPGSGTSFADGATVDCGPKGYADIEVHDDMLKGVITVETDDTTEVFRYDRDSGALRSPAESVAVPFSARMPS